MLSFAEPLSLCLTNFLYEFSVIDVCSAEKRLRHRKAERLGGLGGSKPVSFEAEAPSPCLCSVCALVDATLGLRDALKLALIMKVSPNGTGV